MANVVRELILREAIFHTPHVIASNVPHPPLLL
jgi:hypothetical protein